MRVQARLSKDTTDVTWTQASQAPILTAKGGLMHSLNPQERVRSASGWGGWALVAVPRLAAIAAVALALVGSAGTARDAAAALPPGNTGAQWNQIAEDTGVGSGTLQSEGFICMAHGSAAGVE